MNRGFRVEGVEALDAELEVLKARLLRQGLVPGAVVAAAGTDPWLKLKLLLLLPRLGCPFLPLDPALPPARRESLLALGNASFLLEDGSDKLVRLGASKRSKRPAIAGRPMSGHRIQLLLATSGTTGEPRLVALSGNNLRAAAEAANRVLGLGSADCWLATLPLHHIGGLMTVLRPWLAGAGVALIHPFDPRAVLARLEAGGISHLSLVPTQLLRLLQADPAFRPPADLRVVLVGGAPLETALAERALAAGWPLCPTYGLTEAASQVATCLPPPRRWQAGLAGRVLPHLEVAITEEGRIRLRGASVAAWRLGETGARSLTDHSGWYTTGDLGQWDGKGQLYILGRADDIILTGGEKIHPAAVEAELLRCPGVEEAVVAGVEDEVWGMRVVAGYRGAWPESRVAAWAESHLAGAHRPKRFLRLEEIPRNALGKPLRQVLRRRFQASE